MKFPIFFSTLLYFYWIFEYHRHNYVWNWNIMSILWKEIETSWCEIGKKWNQKISNVDLKEICTYNKMFLFILGSPHLLIAIPNPRRMMVLVLVVLPKQTASFIASHRRRGLWRWWRWLLRFRIEMENIFRHQTRRVTNRFLGSFALYERHLQQEILTLW